MGFDIRHGNIRLIPLIELEQYTPDKYTLPVGRISDTNPKELLSSIKVILETASKGVITSEQAIDAISIQLALKL